MTKAIKIQKNCIHNKGLDKPESVASCLIMPIAGKTTCNNANTKASTNAKCPISINMDGLS
ncbi:MAG: hypothetical protein Rsou_1884 [Candidatus Ruthia sp. Asou_11_S2]|nr:hypothetical protein [Candidatus Ruthia sp. Asou_11_S2]